ncbi:hypothetical protein AKJ09_10500 [Labilithrix luteola]|uniref:Uncharacterized protein n=1 Tax=Labilithrix luteola TaxID=1391654 RepID=A0A0K1QDV8_9BACT|nr:hypothetical protein [Labilithrix luteola]AKV03837.1 hypothetical protein AKJ09_10500 [Labilithrix luteola]
MTRENPSDESAAPIDAARGSWGFPAFAKNFPADPELDALVVAFTNGNYAEVRARAPKLAASATDAAVREAAKTLEDRTKPDEAAKMLFLFAGALLAFLTVWWVLHDGPDDHGASRPATPAPTVEIVK